VFEIIELPKNINKNIIYDFFIKLKEQFRLGVELSTHIKFSEYSMSIPENKEDFFKLIEEYDWNDIYYISFFMKEKFIINLDFIENKIQIYCDDKNLNTELEKFIESYFMIEINDK